jgi:hypothetical protein
MEKNQKFLNFCKRVEDFWNKLNRDEFIMFCELYKDEIYSKLIDLVLKFFNTIYVILKSINNNRQFLTLDERDFLTNKLNNINRLLVAYIFKIFEFSESDECIDYIKLLLKNIIRKNDHMINVVIELKKYLSEHRLKKYKRKRI